jgi:hypothetical protein
MTKDEALRLALDALERSVATCLDPYSYEQVKSRPEHFINQTITALRFVIDAQNMASKSTYKEQLEIKDEYERGFIDGMQKQMQSSVDKAVNAMGKRKWVGLTDDEVYKIAFALEGEHWKKIADAIEAKLKEKNT